MIASFFRPDSERHLYFLLNNALHLASPFCSSTYKIAGLYSIHKNGKCLYVGQSQSLPSRLATHLFGAYENADEFRVYLVCEEHYSDFYQRSKESQKLILENNEARLLQLLKPIENIRADYDRRIDKKFLFLNLTNVSEPPNPSITGLVGNVETENTITVVRDIYESLDIVDKRLFDMETI